jgi:hypothetical protein
MPRTPVSSRTVSSPATESKPSAKRTAAAPAVTERKRTPVRRKSTPVTEFDAAMHYDEIATAAYLNFIARAGTPGSSEEDWILAETTVRAKYI